MKKLKGRMIKLVDEKFSKPGGREIFLHEEENSKSISKTQKFKRRRKREDIFANQTCFCISRLMSTQTESTLNLLNRKGLSMRWDLV